MDEEALITDWQKLSLTSEEENIIISLDQVSADSTSSDLSLSLIGKLLCPRFIPLCQICRRKDETAVHSLLFCSRAKEIWQAFLPEVVLKRMHHLPFKDHWDLWIESLKKEELVLACIICWSIWNDRNLANQGLPIPEIGSKIVWISNYQDELPKAFTCLITKAPSPVEFSTISRHKWTPPPEGCYKINTDASWFSHSSEASVGIVIRDSSGSIVAAKAARRGFFLNPLHSEMEAICCGLDLARKLGILRIILESDSLLAISALHSPSKHMNESNIWIEDCISLRSVFAFSSILHVNRSCNRVADALASFGLSSTHPCTWLINYPPWLITLAMVDSTA